MTLLLGRLPGWALTALAVLAVLVGAYAAGGRVASKAARREQEFYEAKRAAAGAEGVRDAQNEVSNLPAGGAADQLRNDWLRD